MNGKAIGLKLVVAIQVPNPVATLQFEEEN